MFLNFNVDTQIHNIFTSSLVVYFNVQTNSPRYLCRLSCLPKVLGMLQNAIELDTMYLIVLADDKFVFPTADFVTENRVKASLVTKAPQTQMTRSSGRPAYQGEPRVGSVET